MDSVGVGAVVDVVLVTRGEVASSGRVADPACRLVYAPVSVKGLIHVHTVSTKRGPPPLCSTERTSLLEFYLKFFLKFSSR